MKNPNNPAFGPTTHDILGGLTKCDYVYIEVLKSLIVPGKNYTEPEIDILMSNANFITQKVFKK